MPFTGTYDAVYHFDWNYCILKWCLQIQKRQINMFFIIRRYDHIAMNPLKTSISSIFYVLLYFYCYYLLNKLAPLIPKLGVKQASSIIETWEYSPWCNIWFSNLTYAKKQLIGRQLLLTDYHHALSCLNAVWVFPVNALRYMRKTTKRIIC